MLADDLGYGDLSAFGAPQRATPHLDALALGSRAFHSFYAAACVCTPSRAGLLTGSLAFRAGLAGASWSGASAMQPCSPGALPASFPILPELLHAARDVRRPRVSSVPPVPLAHARAALEVPKEIWRLVDALWRRGALEPNLFLEPGIAAEVRSRACARAARVAMVCPLRNTAIPPRVRAGAARARRARHGPRMGR